MAATEVIGVSMGEKMELPQAFRERMERLLGAEYKDFIESYDRDRYYGLRRNPLKASEAEFIAKMPFVLETVGWAKEGYYYQPSEQPGRHVLHEAGAYYIQEPSAMAVVECLDPKPGERILDLCAAPGGKSTQIAGRMSGRGLLVSNEIIQSRAKILSQNIERMGIRNCVVCNETPERMAAFFPGFFDRIVVDAPCSGEGMFRKEDTAVAEWSEEHVAMCAARQKGILAEAAIMLKPGGRLVYSTCTFAHEENEGVISDFLKRHEDFAVEKVACDDSFLSGRPDWTKDAVEGLEHTMRLMPHRLRGEGHYIAVMRRQGGESGLGIEMTEEGTSSLRRAERQSESAVWNKKYRAVKRQPTANKTQATATDRIQTFLTEELGLPGDWLARQHGRLQTFGDQIYLVPDEMIPMDGMKVVRAGLHLATDRKNRLEPAHALAMALSMEETSRQMPLTKEEAERYIHGETLPCEGMKGWTLLTYMGYPLGFGKAAGGQMKNHYPKGLRK
ncbi:MAG: RsmB/NOP family class I SAM-dependent RNA methyltransferase [Eubacterium sp.]|nr:RsmB/NOP family class I SAM-dependent RNA methyltransferase [Eubacterium sp.]